MKSQLQFFLNDEDENKLSEMIKTEFKDSVFVDGSTWDSALPNIKGSLLECDERIVYIWDRSIISELPCVQLADGRYRGPQVGPVIQMIRSIVKKEFFLCSGSLAHSTMSGMERLDNTYKKMRNMLMAISSGGVVLVDKDSKVPLSGEKIDVFHVGAGAYRWCHEDKKRLLSSRNSEHYYLPEK